VVLKKQDWINMAQDINQESDLVNTVLKFQFP
jgi:hypothetical protein